MEKYYLAVDIGASSGRHILAHLKEGQMYIEEIHRFSNEMKNIDGSLCWDVNYLFQEILNGMRKCYELGKIPHSIGIDTWAVDFVLLDKENEIIGKTIAYRDSRTDGMDNKVMEVLSEEELYARNGIQKQLFNTIYQIMAIKERCPEDLEQAESLLMIPDYFHFLLSGKKIVEYTNATTTQLVNPDSKDWDFELIEKLGFPNRIFPKISKPGQVLGDLTEEIQNIVGYNCKVILPATHDTASAVMAVPSNDKSILYISSGTWSLMGTERMEADCSMESRKVNFTNEGGFDYRFRYLKNIMGLWMIQCVKKEIGNSYTFEEICNLAAKEQISSIVDCNDKNFLAPESMAEAIKNYCLSTSQQIPETLGEIACVIYNSLAICYTKVADELEDRTGVSYKTICVVGGGANAEYLNRLTAKYAKRQVLAGPIEATAIGNIAAQMIANKEIDNLPDARRIIRYSFPVQEYNVEY